MRYDGFPMTKTEDEIAARTSNRSTLHSNAQMKANTFHDRSESWEMCSFLSLWLTRVQFLHVDQYWINVYREYQFYEPPIHWIEVFPCPQRKTKTRQCAGGNLLSASHQLSAWWFFVTGTPLRLPYVASRGYAARSRKLRPLLWTGCWVFPTVEFACTCPRGLYGAIYSSSRGLKTASHLFTCSWALSYTKYTPPHPSDVISIPICSIFSTWVLPLTIVC